MPNLSEIKIHERSIVGKMNRLSNTMELLSQSNTKESMKEYSRLEDEYAKLEQEREDMLEAYEKQKAEKEERKGRQV